MVGGGLIGEIEGAPGADIPALHTVFFASLQVGWAAGAADRSFLGALLHTTDGGATWTRLVSCTDKPLYGITVDVATVTDWVWGGWSDLAEPNGTRGEAHEQAGGADGVPLKAVSQWGGAGEGGADSSLKKVTPCWDKGLVAVGLIGQMKTLRCAPPSPPPPPPPHTPRDPPRHPHHRLHPYPRRPIYPPPDHPTHPFTARLPAHHPHPPPFPPLSPAPPAAITARHRHPLPPCVRPARCSPSESTASPCPLRTPMSTRTTTLPSNTTTAPSAAIREASAGVAAASYGAAFGDRHGVARDNVAGGVVLAGGDLLRPVRAQPGGGRLRGRVAEPAGGLAPAYSAFNEIEGDRQGAGAGASDRVRLRDPDRDEPNACGRLGLPTPDATRNAASSRVALSSDGKSPKALKAVSPRMPSPSLAAQPGESPPVRASAGLRKSGGSIVAHVKPAQLAADFPRGLGATGFVEMSQPPSSPPMMHPKP
ncbi:hypothetical protein CYMTET_19223 [Cymbomonas tetramitiformis]|uniref:Photosynthesis system II assembly factor Ycf48/Hcf136-like domain-containing protein n=1 Tax=Cymbomonas tetramitiformis TaxID=36881 RepID=A0AAE0G6K3_9CHLO|nr:hypothetical protein CYMTET_19223 [Cymbomonas tetramitiformis]